MKSKITSTKKKYELGGFINLQDPKRRKKNKTTTGQTGSTVGRTGSTVGGSGKDMRQIGRAHV